eukprot:NODE_31_length_32452_cov_0.352672.p11 type:complete len:322 gc:universal NODE_31_length_32452_cov_0.352672:10035-11000(+)
MQTLVLSTHWNLKMLKTITYLKISQHLLNKSSHFKTKSFISMLQSSDNGSRQKGLLDKLKSVNKFKQRQEYFKNAFLDCSTNLGFIEIGLQEEFKVNPLGEPDRVNIYSTYDSEYYDPWKMFIPNIHTKLICSSKIYGCCSMISFIRESKYPFEKSDTVFIYDIDEYFKEVQKNFTRVMNNKDVDMSTIITKDELETWMLRGVLDGYKILLSSKSQLILTLKQYCKHAAYKPYRDVLEGGIGLNRCQELPTDIWYRMLENIPRIRKTEIDKFILEFPSLNDFFKTVNAYEKSFPNEGFKAIKSVGQATAIRAYNIFFGRDQ